MPTTEKAPPYWGEIEKFVAADRADCAPGEPTLETRFDRQVLRSEPGCWLWQGFRNQDGYGRLSVGSRGRRRLILAHRLALFLAGRPVSPGLVTRHKCHTPACVRPDHLEIGTQAENVSDTVLAGRTARGEKSGHHLLAESAVVEIKGSYEDRHVLAERFGVSPKTIDGLRDGRRWKHIPLAYVPPTKGRGRRAFSAEEIRDIRTSTETSKALGDRYGVSWATVNLARQGLTYAEHNAASPPQVHVSPTRRRNDGQWVTAPEARR